MSSCPTNRAWASKSTRRNSITTVSGERRDEAFMSPRTIAILGAGNGGLAAAADLTLRGHTVRLYSRSEHTLEPIRERGGIELVEGEKKNFAELSAVSTRIAEAVAGADIILIAAPAVAHAGLA